jgi:hypothetical protein
VRVSTDFIQLRIECIGGLLGIGNKPSGYISGEGGGEVSFFGQL